MTGFHDSILEAGRAWEGGTKRETGRPCTEVSEYHLNVCVAEVIV